MRRFYDEVFNKKNGAAIDEFINPNQVDHAAPPGTPRGLQGAKQTINMYLTAFPDLHFTVEDMIAVSVVTSPSDVGPTELRRG